ncbi:hypothetical protein NL676_015791 [Syzygium grande]|nr:hypothetical protein NL676_015791 [Syzygium grande]
MRILSAPVATFSLTCLFYGPCDLDQGVRPTLPYIELSTEIEWNPSRGGKTWAHALKPWNKKHFRHSYLCTSSSSSLSLGLPAISGKRPSPLAAAPQELPCHGVLGLLLLEPRLPPGMVHRAPRPVAQSPMHTIVVRWLGAHRTAVTASPENVKHILRTNFHNFPKGKPFTEILGDFLGRSIFNVDGELWWS